MHPFLFTLGGFSFPAYGLMVAAGYLAAIVYLHKKDYGGALTRDQAADLIFFSAAAGILGGKAVFAATYWKELGPDTASRLAFVFRSFPYGFVFYGGLAAGVAAAFYYCRRRGLDFLKAADHFAPALPLAHGFGRLGCFLAGCCYGSTAGGPLSVVFTDPKCEVPGALLGVPLHPVQLYEAAGNFLLFFGLHLLGRSGAGPLRQGSGQASTPLPSTALRAGSTGPARGAVFAAYLASYSALRFLLEFLRGDDRGGSWLGLSPAQLLAAVFALTAAFIFAASRKNGKPGI